MEASPKKWARAIFLSNRYKNMTTNIAECMSTVLKDIRSFSLVSLLEAIRLLLQYLFYECRNQSTGAITPVMP